MFVFGCFHLYTSNSLTRSLFDARVLWVKWLTGKNKKGGSSQPESGLGIPCRLQASAQMVTRKRGHLLFHAPSGVALIVLWIRKGAVRRLLG